MTPLKTAVLGQIAYAQAIRQLIRNVLRLFLDGEWLVHVFKSSDKEFNSRLGEAFKSLDLVHATERDFRSVIVSILCDEVSDLCLTLREVCEATGYLPYYNSYISHKRFIRLVLSRDTDKLRKMREAVNNKNLSPIDVLREIGNILNDKPLEERVELDNEERDRANNELKSIALATLNAVKENGEKLDNLDEKVSKLRRSSKKKSRYSDEARSLCWTYWITATSHEQIWRSVTTRVTFAAVFNYYESQLKRIGVTNGIEFKKVIRAEMMRRSRGFSR
mgnify:FL=1